MNYNLDPGPEAFDEFHDYWNQLLLARRADERPALGEGPVPLRQAFNPMKVRRQLPHVYIGEWISPDVVEVRLSGTALDAAVGHPLTGKNYLEYFPREDRPFYSAVFENIIKRPCGLKMMRTLTLSSDRRHQLRSLSFPLANKEGVPCYIVGMTNVVRDFHQGSLDGVEHPKSELHSINLIDIGAGVPQMPASLMPQQQAV